MTGEVMRGLHTPQVLCIFIDMDVIVLCVQ